MPVTAQKALDTIYANNRKNVALFFSDPIRQGVTGTKNFVFTYNREKEQYFGLLQAVPGKESNLLVVTNNGDVYAYIIKFKKKLPELNYFIAKEESIGKERPVLDDIRKDSIPLDLKALKLHGYKDFCKYLLGTKLKRLASAKKQGLKLRLQAKEYKNTEVYLVIEMTNTSTIDFEIDQLQIFITNGTKRRKSSFQKLLQKVIYKHKFPEMIKKEASQKFVFVLPKFVLGEMEKLQIEIYEKNGGRKVVLRD